MTEIDTTITPETFEVTTLRGTPLLRHVLDILEREAAALEDHPGDADGVDGIGLWNQGTWGEAAPSDQFMDIARAQLGDKFETTSAVGVELTAEQAIECGTAFCFAGHAALLAGAHPIFDLNLQTIELYGASARMYDVLDEHGSRWGVPSYAKDLLELDSETADLLFESENTLDDLREIVRRVEAGEPVKLCEACDTGVWRCEYDGDACGGCGNHTECCDCCERCERPVWDCCCCGECAQVEGECTCEEDDA